MTIDENPSFTVACPDGFHLDLDGLDGAVIYFESAPRGLGSDRLTYRFSDYGLCGFCRTGQSLCRDCH